MRERHDHATLSEEEFDPERRIKLQNSTSCMTAFFSRSYKCDYAQPAVLTKRLPDIGDITVAETVDEGEEEKENNRNYARASSKAFPSGNSRTL
ncbi:hypothetical protein BT96DRAFT_212741 [Gymnopus androsaceus JB14]|uniref:Uncharacterized protein n=1 Tax=Gymnopus androsaceus JB14 TaxID=1447944 RepID=A0A6A4H7A0_9AGAR|nr:hypothetical protein BT96DRAFT_212741 [Gymnopus androsaceus JB14]